MPDDKRPTPTTLRRALGISSAFAGGVLIPGLSVLHVIADSDLNRLGRYLCFAIAAVGVDLAWGYGGILTFWQPLLVGIAALAISMFLSLPQGGGDVRPEYHSIPQFFYYLNVDHLPAFWKPFGSLPLALLIGLAMVLVISAGGAYYSAKAGVVGVKFSLLTFVIEYSALIGFSQNQWELGGTNGLTNFYKPLNSNHWWILSLYLVTFGALILVVKLNQTLLTWRLKNHARVESVVTALRTSENTLAPLNVSPAFFKGVLCAVAGFDGWVAGTLYPAQNGIFTPNMMRIQEAVALVAYVAVGGRRTLWGAAAGALFVNYLSSTLSTDAPDLWPLVFGSLFIASVLRPGGLAGLWAEMELRVASRRLWQPFALLLGGLGLFVVAEALGFMPPAMELRFAGVPVKYYSLAVCSAWYLWDVASHRKDPHTA